MSVKNTARLQYVRLVDQAVDQLADLPRPREGWIASARKALGMSGAQLAKRAGVTRAAIYQAERNERDAAISLRQMEKLADAMGARLVYAIVPKHHVEEVIRERAVRKAQRVVQRASAHMALESQALSREQNQEEIQGLADDFVRSMPADFWEDR
jgi:predicted DNA-binding mobile mystery protein A